MLPISDTFEKPYVGGIGQKGNQEITSKRLLRSNITTILELVTLSELTKAHYNITMSNYT